MGVHLRYRVLGRTGLRVAELFLGAMAFSEQRGVGVPLESGADRAREVGLRIADEPHEDIHLYGGGQRRRVTTGGRR